MTALYAAIEVPTVYRTYPWKGYAPGPLTARIWGLPMRAARGRTLWQRIFDKRWDDWQDSLLDNSYRAWRCQWCGETDCDYPMH